MYETPPNFSLFGDQWHFMMRALNFNAFPSPTSLFFLATHLLCLRYGKVTTISLFQSPLRQVLYESSDTLEFSLEPRARYPLGGDCLQEILQPILPLLLST